MITIDNKEWFDSNGNTYFSAEVYLNSDLIMSMPMQYGYSEHCKQVFEMAFCKHFKIDYQNAPGWVVRETLGKNGIKISVSTRDVKKRDLNKGEAFQDFSPFLKPENLALYAHYRMQNNVPVSWEQNFDLDQYRTETNIVKGLSKMTNDTLLVFDGALPVKASYVSWF